MPYEVHEFDAYLSYPVRASLRVLEPVEKEIRAKTRAFGASTPPEGLEGEVVFVPSRSRASASRRWRTSTRASTCGARSCYSSAAGPDGVLDAMRAGAIAHIHMWPSNEDAIHEMISTSVWGTPTPESAERIPTIPSISVNHESGEYLRELCARARCVCA